MPNAFQDLFPPYSAPRPLDPNGVDVYGELPFMLNALKAANAQQFRGREAGYALFPSLNGVYHTGLTLGPELHMAIPTPKDALGVVHTHPPVDALPEPSEGDLKSRVPNYVFSGNQLYVTDPKTRKYYKYDISRWNHPAINAFLAFQK